MPNQNWIKRVIGLPGDTIESHGDQLVINGKPVPADELGPYVGNPKREEDRVMLDYGATVSDGASAAHRMARHRSTT